MSGNRLFSHIPDLPYLEIAKGRVPGHSIVHKFGAGALDNSIKPISNDNTYPTPTAAVNLEFLSSSATDNASGIGAREITIDGIDENWNEVIQTLVTNGTTPVALSTPLLRLFRWFVSSSGTYATELVGSHQGTLTIRVASAGAVWSTIGMTPWSVGQSQIGIYTIPIGKTAFMISKNIFVDSVKAADVYFFQRKFADDVTVPFSGTMRLFQREIGVSGGYNLTSMAPKGPFVGPCDIGFMGVVAAGTADVSVEFELLLIENQYTNP